MTKKSYDLFEETCNPLDSAEELFKVHNWSFQRMNIDEVIAEVKTKTANYHLHFIWQEDHNALLFACEYQKIAIHEDNTEQLAATLMEINNRIWLGHFETNPHSRSPIFRHTSLFKGTDTSSGLSHIEDLIDIALHECDRFHSAFQVLTEDSLMHAAILSDTAKHMDLALMDVAGRS